MMNCTNCGKSGHTKFKCYEPFTSYGIVLFNSAFPLQLANIDKKINIAASNKVNYNLLHEARRYLEEVRFLIIRKKHSYSMIEFVCGKYEIDDVAGLSTLFQYLTVEELHMIETQSYERCFRAVMGGGVLHDVNRAKFNRVRSSPLFSKLKLLVSYVEPEWGFPKGRKGSGETNLECAMREFCEETNISDEVTLYNRILPLSETYIGTDGQNYKHTYFIAQHVGTCSTDAIVVENSNEVSEMRWIRLDEIDRYFRPYQFDKKKILCELFLFVLHNHHVKKTI